jgi:hypothetical protein
MMLSTQMTQIKQIYTDSLCGLCASLSVFVFKQKRKVLNG